MSSERHLSIYLNDHLAGSTAGYELAKRAASNNKGTPLGDLLGRLAGEIDEDRKVLEGLMSELGIQRNIAKGAAMWVAEKAGRLKFNGQLTGYSDLSRLIELEGLTLGVEGKLAMWRTLIQIRDKYPPLAGANLEELARRAQDQLSELDGAHKDAAARAL
jgi:hypothetical protein